jgi:hypothetical protein
MAMARIRSFEQQHILATTPEDMQTAEKMLQSRSTI